MMGFYCHNLCCNGNGEGISGMKLRSLIQLSLIVKVLVISHVSLFETQWTIVHQAPLSMEFLRQEYWRGLPFPSPVDLLNPGIEPSSPALAGRLFNH